MLISIIGYPVDNDVSYPLGLVQFDLSQFVGKENLNITAVPKVMKKNKYTTQKYSLKFDITIMR